MSISLNGRPFNILLPLAIAIFIGVSLRLLYFDYKRVYYDGGMEDETILIESLDSVASGERFLLVLPYEGMTNQILGILRGSHLAAKLNRTLLIPPIVRSQHEEGNSCSLWEEWPFNWNEILTECSLSLDWSVETSSLPVYTFGRHRYWRNYGQSTMNSLRIFNIIDPVLRWRPFKKVVQSSQIIDYFAKNINDRFIVIGQLQHVHFESEVFQSSVKRLYQSLHLSIVVQSLNFGVHWRRGDFASSCLVNKDISTCWPSVELLCEETLLNSTVYLSSDDPDCLVDWSTDCPSRNYTTSRNLSCASRYFADLMYLVGSERFIGNPYSTLSRLVHSLREHK